MLDENRAGETYFFPRFSGLFLEEKEKGHKKVRYSENMGK